MQFRAVYNENMHMAIIHALLSVDLQKLHTLYFAKQNTHAVITYL